MPIIAISYEPFSQGEELASEVAEGLNYQCVTQQALLEMTRNYGIPVETFRTPKRPPFIDRVIGFSPLWPTVFVRAALCEIAASAELVCHGPVGHLLIPGIAHVIRVLVVSDRDFRMATAMERLNLGRSEAAAYLRREDMERREWVRHHFDVDWDDCHGCDVVFALGRMSLATAREALFTLAKRPEFQPSAESSQAFRDLSLASRVTVALATNGRTRESDLHVDAVNGIVTIAGKTMFSSVLDSIPPIARQVDGVREIRSQVLLSAPFETTA
jgi:two-component system, OmpR family, response regulator CpxR